MENGAAENVHVDGNGNATTAENVHVDGNGNATTAENVHVDGNGNATTAENVHVDGNGNATTGSYTYWVRETTSDAAPLPLPKKLTAQDVICTQSQPATLGSVWNRAGTWEEKNVNHWATQRLKELLKSVGSLDLSCGKAELSDVTKCVGDAFLVTVRNKKRVGYTYELTLKINGEWHLQEEKKSVRGHIHIPEFSFGELDDLQMDVQLSQEKDFLQQDKKQIIQELKKLFLQPVREKLLQFEQELKDR